MRLWFAMLLAPRSDAPLHRDTLDDDGITALAKASVEKLFSGIWAPQKA